MANCSLEKCFHGRSASPKLIGGLASPEDQVQPVSVEPETKQMDSSESDSPEEWNSVPVTEDWQDIVAEPKTIITQLSGKQRDSSRMPRCPVPNQCTVTCQYAWRKSHYMQFQQLFKFKWKKLVSEVIDGETGNTRCPIPAEAI